jgi:hypothetical protein
MPLFHHQLGPTLPRPAHTHPFPPTGPQPPHPSLARDRHRRSPGSTAPGPVSSRLTPHGTLTIAPLPDPDLDPHPSFFPFLFECQPTLKQWEAHHGPPCRLLLCGRLFAQNHALASLPLPWFCFVSSSSWSHPCSIRFGHSAASFAPPQWAVASCAVAQNLCVILTLPVPSELQDDITGAGEHRASVSAINHHRWPCLHRLHATSPPWLDSGFTTLFSMSPVTCQCLNQGPRRLSPLSWPLTAMLSCQHRAWWPRQERVGAPIGRGHHRPRSFGLGRPGRFPLSAFGPSRWGRMLHR